MILSMNEFVGNLKQPTHLLVGEAASKTIFTNNIIKGQLRVNNSMSKGKLVVANNADDGDDGLATSMI